MVYYTKSCGSQRQTQMLTIHLEKSTKFQFLKSGDVKSSKGVRVIVGLLETTLLFIQVKQLEECFVIIFSSGARL